MKRPPRSLPDTNIVIRYLVRDDPVLYDKAQAYFDAVKNGDRKALILESVVAECIYVLTKLYRVPRVEAAQCLVDILSFKGIANTDRRELAQALAEYAASTLDIVDCILLAKAMAQRDSLFTFDVALTKRMKKK